MAILKQGYGFHVGQNFARATRDLSIELIEEFKDSSDPQGYIDAQPDSPLSFLRHPARIKVRTIYSAIEA